MIVWLVFIAIILLFLAFDLGFFNKTPKVISTKEAAFWTLTWVSLALLFSFSIFLVFKRGWVDNPTNLAPSAAMLKYITGYLIELSLSIDNIFVIAVIFFEFRIPQKYQHRVLFWGIIGAIVFRAFMIFFGVALFRKFEWITFIFGIFLIFTAIKLITSKAYGKVNIKNSFTFRIIRKFIPITSKLENEKFFIRRKHILAATPLFLALIMIELTDVLFALDSIPAILAITTDPFLLFS
jgi:tellurite resistance protein TerC